MTLKIYFLIHTLALKKCARTWGLHTHDTKKTNKQTKTITFIIKIIE